MILDKFHVFQRNTGTVGERHSVAGLNCRIGRKWKDAPAAARAEDNVLSGKDFHLTVVNINGAHATDLPIIDQERCGIELIVAQDVVVFERGLKQSVKHVKAGLVGGKNGAIDSHASEGPNADASIRVAAPRTAPMLKLEDLSGSFFDKGLDRVLIGEEVSAEDRVLGVEIQVVVFSQDRGGAALG